MSFTFDVFDTVKKPNVYLCQVDKEIIGALKVFNANFTDKFNDINEFSFSVSRQYIDTYGNEIINPIYDMVQGIRIVYVEGIGYFEIQEPNINSNGIYEIKECTALSLEQDLTKKYLKTFIINQGTTASIDGVTFYNPADESHSLMHLVLEKLPQWSIGHIDGELVNMSRYFEVDEQDVYSFLVNEVSETFRCVFKFDTYNNTINAYTYENSGEDTSLYISYKNLANEIGISYTADDIVTCLTVKGAEDLDVSGVNMGQDSILDLSYYHTVEDMGQELYDAWNNYIEIYDLKKPNYESLVVTMEGLYDEYHELNNRVPDDTTSENWTLYGLSYLNIKKSLFENNVQFQADLGWAETSNLNHAAYTVNKNKLNAINAEIKVRESQITGKENQISSVQSQMNTIANEVNYQNSFTSAQLKKLSKFIREGTWQDDNFLITETDTPNQIIAIQQELLNNGEKYLKQLSQPQLEFDMSMANILALPEFKKISDKFKVGNYIYVTLREGYSFKVRLLEYTFVFDELNNFNATFGNLTRLKDETDKAAEILDQARSSGKSVAAWKSRWQSGASTAVSIEQMIKDGLSTSVTNIKSSNNRNDITIDQTGIRMRTLKDDGTYDTKEGWITGSKFLYSNDNFATAKSAFGEFTVDGLTRYGLLAEAVLAGFIGGSVIVGGRIESENWNGTDVIGSGTTGTYINLNNGTFNFGGGKIKYDGTTLTVKGAIEATSLTISSAVANNAGIATTSQLPTKTSQLNNDSGYQNETGVTTITKGVVTTDYVNALGVTANRVVVAGKFDANVANDSVWIGGWYVGESGIYRTDGTWGAQGGMYFGDSGLSVGNLFKVNQLGQAELESTLLNGGSATGVTCKIHDLYGVGWTDMFGSGIQLRRTDNSKIVSMNNDSIVVRNGGDFVQIHSTYITLQASNGTTTTISPGNAGSLAEWKTNIVKEDSLLETVLSTDVYSYNYKYELEKGIDKTKYGFVIGEGYNTTDKVVSDRGDNIELYSSIAIAWQGIRELHKIISNQQIEINNLKETLING